MKRVLVVEDEASIREMVAGMCWRPKAPRQRWSC